LGFRKEIPHRFLPQFEPEMHFGPIGNEVDPSEVEAFKKFFPSELIDHLVHSTNEYAHIGNFVYSGGS